MALPFSPSVAGYHPRQPRQSRPAADFSSAHSARRLRLAQTRRAVAGADRPAGCAGEGASSSSRCPLPPFSTPIGAQLHPPRRCPKPRCKWA